MLDFINHIHTVGTLMTILILFPVVPHAQQNSLTFMPKFGFDLVPGHGIPRGM